MSKTLMTEMSRNELETIIKNTLFMSGWTPVAGAALAQKSYFTAVGFKTAFVYLGGPDEYHYVLSGSYYSEGRNCLEPHAMLIKRTLLSAGIAQQVAAFCAQTDQVIAETYAARLIRL